MTPDGAEEPKSSDALGRSQQPEPAIGWALSASDCALPLSLQVDTMQSEDWMRKRIQLPSRNDVEGQFPLLKVTKMQATHPLM